MRLRVPAAHSVVMPPAAADMLRPAAAAAAGSRLQSSIRYGQRGAKEQPSGSASTLGTLPGIGVRRGRSPPSSNHGRCAVRDAGEQALRVGMALAFEQRIDRRRLDHAAGIHDHHVLRDLGDDAEIVRDEHHAHPELGLQAAQQVQHLRLDRHVERGRRLVGDEQRADCRRAPGRSWRAGACRRTSGAGNRRAAAPPRGSRRVPACAGPAGAPRPADTRSCSRIISTIWSPTVKSGLRLVIGSWKIIAISRPRMARIAFPAASRGRARGRRGAVEDAPADDAAGRRQQAHDREAGDRLAGPDSPRPPPRSRRARR